MGVNIDRVISLSDSNGSIIDEEGIEEEFISPVLKKLLIPC